MRFFVQIPSFHHSFWTSSTFHPFFKFPCILCVATKQHHWKLRSISTEDQAITVIKEVRNDKRFAKLTSLSLQFCQRKSINHISYRWKKLFLVRVYGLHDRSPLLLVSDNIPFSLSSAPIKYRPGRQCDWTGKLGVGQRLASRSGFHVDTAC